MSVTIGPPDMTVVYLCHPVSGDVAGNLRRAERWVKWIETTYPVAVVASWITECRIWDDNNPEHRAAGLRRDFAVLARCDEVWLVGGRISNGMAYEAAYARQCEIPVVDMTSLGDEPPEIG